MLRDLTRAIFYLMSAACSGSSNNCCLCLLSYGWKQYEFSNLHRYVKVFLFKTKGSRHAATTRWYGAYHEVFRK